MSTEILITGMGAVTPAGVGVAAFWQAILKGESVLGPVCLFPESVLPATHGGHIIDPLFSDTSIPKSIQFARAAAEEALAALPHEFRAGCGLVAATNFGANMPGPQNEAQKQLSTLLGVSGPRATLSLSCASGASAIAYAADLISSGRAARVLVVGFDELSPFSWSGLCALRTMTREPVVRPFDKNRSGTLFSEGAAAMLVESAPACAERGGEPLAVLAGWATGSNGYHLTAPAPRGAGSLDVMRRALARAGATPADIGYFNAHGTGTKHNDLTETQAFQDLCGDRAGSIPVSSVKGTVGHLLGAAGTAEAIATVMSIREGVIPPTANLAEKDPACPLDIVAGAPRAASIDLAISNSAGIGGCNGAVVIRKAAKEVEAAAETAGAEKYCVVTGIGILSPLGIGAEENRLALEEGEPALEPGADGRLEGRVPPFDFAEFVPTPKNYLDRQSELLLAACGMAIAQAGGMADTPPERRAVCAATAWGGRDTVALFNLDLVNKGPRLVKPMLFQHAYANTGASLVATEWEMRGPHLNFTTGHIASAQALLAAMDAIASGEADVALACAAETLPANVAGVAKNSGPGSLAPGEAGVALVLESEEHAAARGAKALLRIRSGAWLADGREAGVELSTAVRQLARDMSKVPEDKKIPMADQAMCTDALCGDTLGASSLLRIALDSSILAVRGQEGVPTMPRRMLPRLASSNGQYTAFCLEALNE